MATELGIGVYQVIELVVQIKRLIPGLEAPSRPEAATRRGGTELSSTCTSEVRQSAKRLPLTRKRAVGQCDWAKLGPNAVNQRYTIACCIGETRIWAGGRWRSTASRVESELLRDLQPGTECFARLCRQAILVYLFMI
jgi:hypothetical protein